MRTTMNLRSMGMSEITTEGKQRYGFLDMVRGITLISMILFHGAWDMVYLYGKEWSWYRSEAAYVWQQSICWTFILLSGFCWSMGRKPLRRGLLVFGAGAAVTLVTLLVMPADRVIFGVLTLIGSCMLLMIPMDRVGRYMPKAAGFLISIVLFGLTRDINRGYLGFEGLRLCKLPKEWYSNMVTTYLGFPSADFFSTDYFSLIPWLFLFMAGYFLYHILESKKWMKTAPFSWKIEPLAFIGRHSLLIYMLHQPVLFVVCGIVAKI